MTNEAAVALVLAASDRADLELKLRHQAFREGWNACRLHMGDRYEQGYADGLLADKHIQHALYEELKNYLIMWDGGLRHTWAQRTGGDT